MQKILTATLFVLSVTSAHATCNAENANYKHIEDKTFNLALSKQKDSKAWSNIQASLQTPNRKLDFEFTASNGYETHYMVMLTPGIKQERDIAVSFLAKNLNVLLLPQAGDVAPEYIFTPELGLWLYYSGLEPQDYLPPGIWKFDSCRPA